MSGGHQGSSCWLLCGLRHGSLRSVWREASRKLRKAALIQIKTLPMPDVLRSLAQALLASRSISVDEYLLWSIAEGGKQFGTNMPAFKGTLSRREIWEIVSYMRAGFPEPGPSGTYK